jgi:Domain of unknown function (DUF4258)
MRVTLAMPRICLLLLFFEVFTSCHTTGNGTDNNNPSAPESNRLPFNRHSRLVLTKHARCRMDCRHITIDEIHEILDEGSVNYTKSEPNARPDPRYAIEGVTEEHQHLRIIIAPEKDKLIIITCIELGVEWRCDCN